MQVEIKIIISRDELSQYCSDYYLVNNKLPTSEEAREFFINQFIGDYHQFIFSNNFVVILRVNEQEARL
jgi:hypothetical protein